MLRACGGAVRDLQERSRVGEGVRGGGQVQEGGRAILCRRRFRKGVPNLDLSSVLLSLHVAAFFMAT